MKSGTRTLQQIAGAPGAYRAAVRRALHSASGDDVAGTASVFRERLSNALRFAKRVGISEYGLETAVESIRSDLRWLDEYATETR